MALYPVGFYSAFFALFVVVVVVVVVSCGVRWLFLLLIRIDRRG